MSDKLLLPLNELKNQGQDLEIEVTDLGLELIQEFALDCKIIAPLKSYLNLLPLEDGVLVKGKLASQVLLQCNRCAEEFEHQIAESFERFETLPDKDSQDNYSQEDFKDLESESRIILSAKQEYLLDLKAILGEEFVLALPTNPLCKSDCKGLCPNCGTNLNFETCHCKKEVGDPRLKIFSQIKIPPKS